MSVINLSSIRAHKWKTTLLVILASVLIALPYLMQSSIQKALLEYSKPYGIQHVEIDDIDFNPFSAELGLYGLALYTDKPGKQQPITELKALTQLEKLEINLHWLPLLDGRIWLEQIRFQGAELPFQLDEQQTLSLAGIPIPMGKQAEPTEQNETPIAFGIDNVVLEGIELSLTAKGKNTLWQIHSLTLEHLYSWETDYARLIIDSQLNNSPLTTNLQLHLFQPEPKVVGTLRTQQLVLANFQHLLPPLDFEAYSVFSSDITFTLQQGESGIKLYQQGEFALNKTAFKQGDLNSRFGRLHWKGDIHLFQEQSTSLLLRGKAKLDDLKLKTKDLQLQQNLEANLNTRLKLVDGKAQIQQQGKVSISALHLQQEPYDIRFSDANWNGSVDFTDGDSRQIQSQGKLAIKRLAFDDGKQQLNTDLDAQLNTTTELHAKSLSVEHQGELQLSQLTASQQALAAKLKKLGWQGKLQLKQSEKQSRLQSTGSLKLDELMASNSEQQYILAQIGALAIEQLKVATLDDITLQKLQIQQLQLGQPQAVKTPGLVEIKQLNLSQARLQQFNDLQLGKLTIQDSRSHLTLNKENQVIQVEQLLASLPMSTEATTEKPEKTQKIAKPAETEAATTPTEPFHYALQGLEISGDNRIQIQSQRTEPALKKTLQLQSLTLGAIDSRQPQQSSPFAIKVVLDEFSTLNSRGTVQPLTKTINLIAKTELDGLSLVEFSPLVEQAVGYQIRSGQVSAELETKLKNNKIDAKNQLHLHKLELESADAKKSADFEKGFPVPLQVGLGLLQDKNQNIDLSLPIKGDLNDPNINIQDVIGKALGGALAGATRAYLMLALQPFGAIAMVTEMAAGGAGALQLQAVEFAPGSSTLSPKMRDYLGKIHKLLSERKSVQIKLCGGTSEPDRMAMHRAALRRAIAEQADAREAQEERDGKPAKQGKIQVPHIEISDQQMLELAKRRQAAIKRYLIKLGSKGKQIFICKPKLNKKDVPPVVELGI